MAVFAVEKYSVLNSRPMLLSPQAVAAAIVEPEPMNGSKIVPSPSGSAARAICRRKFCGFKDGCGAISLSRRLAGDDWIRSLKGSESEIRRNPPVFHFLRLSWTLPSHGLRNRPHGSQHDLGITVTSENSSCAFFGRSPPRNV